jgi:hypothetical protein
MERLSEQIRRVDPRETATDLYCITMLFLFPLFPGFSGYADITFSNSSFRRRHRALAVALAFLTLRGRLPLRAPARRSGRRSRSSPSRCCPPVLPVFPRDPARARPL